ncbi:class I SAM-dependent methyltransferase [Sciscionella marina]|uniref:class I SAM-dependent methyltransferase n=1 Tax=Sciscionella marina TaxID=508770 RepID=UPI00036F5B29|nr:class I SAM-dependent methyltransferase [Sciscionella marina]
MRKIHVGLLAGAAAAGAAVWWFGDRAPYPYAQRWLLDLPLPMLGAKQLDAVLDPRPGERILEIGPGTGLQALQVAPTLGPRGGLDIVDIQQDMLDHVQRRAQDRGIDNITATRADARELPFADGCFDAVYLVTALGEIPDQHAVLGEAARVLTPQGRLVVGEFFDRHWIPRSRLRRMADSHGLRMTRHRGPSLAYLARFDAEG